MMSKLLFFILLFAQFGFATEVATTLSEEQIPLKIEQQVRATDASTNSTKMALSFAVVGLMLGAAYYFIRKYSIANKTPSKSNMQIKVLSQHYLGPKKSLVIVRVAGESILIGVTEKNISMIKALSLLDDELPQVLPKNFEESLNQTNQQADQSDDIGDDFSFSGLKLSVSEKLKSMRSFQ